VLLDKEADRTLSHSSLSIMIHV